MVTRTTLLSILLSLILALNAYTAEESKTDKQQTAPADKATELQKEIQNPLSGLILLPIEYSYTGSVGPLQKSSQEMIIEPTFPINISKDWKILTHTLIPIVSLPEIVGEDSSSGLSNIMFSALLAKKTQKVFTWGAGAGLMFPTASNTDPISWTNTPTGYDCWAAGPSVVGVYKKGNWVAGALLNQMWTFSGESNYNVLQIQGLAYYNLGQGYSIGTMPLITIDWTTSADQSTLLPLGLMVGKLFMIGDVFPLGLSVGTYYNIIKPDAAPQSTLNAELFFVLPTFW